MNANNQPVACVKGTSTLVRAKFGPGMLLQHDDLEQLTTYTRELNRLMFRSLFGCGVVCGLVVSVEENCKKLNVKVQSGLALDCNGNPIYVPKEQPLSVDEQCFPDLTGPLWVVLCGTEKCCAPRTAMCASDEDETPSVCTRERDGFEIRIVRTRPPCTCSCPEPDPDRKDRTQDLIEDKCKCVNPEHKCCADHYAGTCGCDCDDCEKCDCDCVLLARLEISVDPKYPGWQANHRVRRFVRPVLMRDPQVEREYKERQKPKDEKPKDEKAKDESAESAEADAQPDTREPDKRDKRPRGR